MKTTIYIILNRSNRVQMLTMDAKQASRAILNAHLSLTTKEVDIPYASEWNWRQEEPDWDPMKESWDQYRARTEPVGCCGDCDSCTTPIC